MSEDRVISMDEFKAVGKSEAEKKEEMKEGMNKLSILMAAAVKSNYDALIAEGFGKADEKELAVKILKSMRN